MKSFKFLKRPLNLMTQFGLIKLKDIHNRNAYMHIKWSQFSTEAYEDDNLEVFYGTILEFYRKMNLYRLKVNPNFSGPVIFEILKKRKGYFTSSVVLSNHLNHPNFISRAYKLKILFSYEPL